MKSNSLPPPKTGRPKKETAQKSKAYRYNAYDWEQEIYLKYGSATEILRDFAAKKLKEAQK